MNDSSYTLHLDYIPKSNNTFQKGHTPWNKGLSWEEQGWTEERKEKVLAQLKVNMSKNKYENCAEHLKKPVIQMDEYGNRLHWYASSEAAARKLGLQGRNIRKVCDGERNFCGGYRWKWDERFL
jgi:hypothetical protein